MPTMPGLPRTAPRWWLVHGLTPNIARACLLTGKSFRIMAIDIQTIKDGKIARTYHLENWLSALGQLRAK
jgi:hypothetical protein